MENKKQEDYPWLKSKGYLHVTAQIDVIRRRKEIIAKVQNTEYISKYAFFPLIHSIIKERKYKRVKGGNQPRAHSYVEDGVYKTTAKNRPLHYATHMDAIIFAYYADILQQKYEVELEKFPVLSESIIAYRKIPVDEDTNKSTIHFANEIFEEIKLRCSEGKECVVLAFDIKSFFSSLDHELLRKAWAKLMGVEKLEKDHYNVFKAATRFSYIMRDDLRYYTRKKGKRAGFDEKELARIRNNFGIKSFFESPKALRDKIQSGQLKIHKFPFRDKDTNLPIGIPQGLPISAVLANLYLLDFDLKILNSLVEGMGCYYKRYSDDIAVVCTVEQKEKVEKFVTEAIKDSKVKISEAKTEIFHFKRLSIGNKNDVLTSTAVSKANPNEHKLAPFIYLGFEFNGRNILIKSSNLAKFYRRLVSAVKRKAARANKIAGEGPGTKKAVIFRRQLYKLYSNIDLNKIKTHSRRSFLVKTETGQFRLKSILKTKQLASNYFNYAKRASVIMNEPMIFKQVRNHKKIFNQAVNKHLQKQEPED